MANYGELSNFVISRATILSGATVSDAIDLIGRGCLVIYLPATFTGATITFQGSYDNVTFLALYNTSNTQMSMTVTQNRAYVLSPEDLVGIRYLKLVSGSAEGADRTITLVTRQLS